LVLILAVISNLKFKPKLGSDRQKEARNETEIMFPLAAFSFGSAMIRVSATVRFQDYKRDARPA
jgi:hypothetical protein